MLWQEPRILLYGGSFDPPHLGHSACIKAALNRFSRASLWVLPAYAPPQRAGALKPNVSLFEHRFKMCEAAFGSIPRVRVMDIESGLPQPSYTWQSIKHIKRSLLPAFGRHELALLMGLDQLQNLAQWFEVQSLLTALDLVVVHRPQADAARQVDIDLIRASFRSMHLEIQPMAADRYLYGDQGCLYYLSELDVPVASSDLRQQASSERQNWLQPKVEEYIQTHHLYQKG